MKYMLAFNQAAFISQTISSAFTYPLRDLTALKSLVNLKNNDHFCPFHCCPLLTKEWTPLADTALF